MPNNKIQTKLFSEKQLLIYAQSPNLSSFPFILHFTLLSLKTVATAQKFNFYQATKSSANSAFQPQCQSFIQYDNLNSTCKSGTKYITETGMDVIL